MPKYACGNEAQCGDVVRVMPYSGTCILLPGETYTVSGFSEVDSSLVTIRELQHLEYSPAHFELIRRQEETMNEPSEMIDHPPHYAALTPEPIDVIESWGLEFHEANALKYIARATRKGCRVEDLCKAAWYLTRKAELLEGKQ